MLVRPCLMLSWICATLCLGAAQADRPALVILADWESPDQVAQWTPLAANIAFSRQHPSHGQGCAALRIPRYKGTGEKYPRMTGFHRRGAYPTKDWSAYSEVRVEFHNPTDSPDRISFELRDHEARNGWYRGYVLPPRSTTPVRVELAEVAKKVDLKDIVEVIFYKGMPKDDFCAHVDYLRLLTPEMAALARRLDLVRGAVARFAEPRPAVADQAAAQLRRWERAAAAGGLSCAAAKALDGEIDGLERQLTAALYRAAHAFDFGPAASGVQPHFEAVTAATRYRADRGYGWRTDEKLIEFTRPASREWTYSAYNRAKRPPAVYLNALTQDCVGGRADAEFVVDLPAGSYEVYVLAGVPSGYSPYVNRFAVALAGHVRDEIGLCQPRIWEHRTYRITLDKGPLAIGLRPSVGWVLSAMLIYPAADAARARKEQIGPLEQEIYRLPPSMWAAWTRVAEPADPKPAAAAEAERRGYVLFRRPYTTNVYPGSAPQPGEEVDALATFATPGEYEPVTFSLYPLRDLKDVRVEVSGLRGPDGATIPAGNIDVRAVRCWFVRTSYSSHTNYQLVPEVLLHTPRQDMAAQESHRYWITVRVPASARPGVYETAVRVHCANGTSSALPFKLDVLPFHLERDPAKAFGMYYYDPRHRLSSIKDEKARQAVVARARAECIDMREHGMTTIQLYGSGGHLSEDKTKFTVDVTDVDQAIRLYRSTGLVSDRPAVLYFRQPEAIYRALTGTVWPKHIHDIALGTDAYYELVTDVVRQYEAAAKARGWPPLVYYPIDEAAAEAAPFLRRMLQAIRACPGARTYVTQVYQREASRVFEPWVDCWCSGVFFPEPAKVRALTDKGVVFWCYPNYVACSRGVPGWARMTYGFGLWRSEYSCLIPWHYQAPCGNPFNDFDSWYGDWCEAYPSLDQPIPTQRWEATREGIDDGKYIYTLEQRLAAAGHSRDAEVSRAAAEAGAYLERLRANIVPRDRYADPHVWTGDEFQHNRRTIADYIVRLQRLQGSARKSK